MIVRSLLPRERHAALQPRFVVFSHEASHPTLNAGCCCCGGWLRRWRGIGGFYAGTDAWHPRCARADTAGASGIYAACRRRRDAFSGPHAAGVRRE